MKLTKLFSWLLGLGTLGAAAYARPHPEAPEAGTEPSELDNVTLPEKDDNPSNVGAVNEGGGSVNTNGMNNGLSPNSSGSGTTSARASEQTGVDLGGGGSRRTSQDTSNRSVVPGR